MLKRTEVWRMPYSGMWRRVALVRTDVSRGETYSLHHLDQDNQQLGAMLEVPSNGSIFVLVIPSSLIPSTLMMDRIRSSETSILTRVTRRHISEDGILYIHRRENLKSYKLIYIFVFSRSTSINWGSGPILCVSKRRQCVETTKRRPEATASKAWSCHCQFTFEKQTFEGNIHMQTHQNYCNTVGSVVNLT
jgi:hypothetical protein